MRKPGGLLCYFPPHAFAAGSLAETGNGWVPGSLGEPCTWTLSNCGEGRDIQLHLGFSLAAEDPNLGPHDAWQAFSATESSPPSLLT